MFDAWIMKAHNFLLLLLETIFEWYETRMFILSLSVQLRISQCNLCNVLFIFSCGIVYCKPNFFCDQTNKVKLLGDIKVL